MPDGGSTRQTGSYEQMLLRLDEGAIGALYRVAIGFVTIPAYDFLFGNPGADWTIVPFLLAVLFLLRFALAVVRKLIRFPADVVEVWAVRRRTAKYYDSYQWRKMLWVGIGLGLFLVISGEYRPMNLALTIFCLVSGIAGTVIWSRIAADSTLAKPMLKWRKPA